MGKDSKNGLGEEGFGADAIESVMRERIRQTIEVLVEEEPAAALGLNKSILPMNINVDFWGNALGTRADLLVPANNIAAGARILGDIQANLSPGASIAKVGTLYNNLGATTVSNYGARVEAVYRLRPWR